MTVYEADPEPSHSSAGRIFTIVAECFVYGCLTPLVVSTPSCCSTLRSRPPGSDEHSFTRRSIQPSSSFWWHSNGRPSMRGACLRSTKHMIMQLVRSTKEWEVPSSSITRWSVALLDAAQTMQLKDHGLVRLGAYTHNSRRRSGDTGTSSGTSSSVPIARSRRRGRNIAYVIMS